YCEEGLLQMILDTVLVRLTLPTAKGSPIISDSQLQTLEGHSWECLSASCGVGGLRTIPPLAVPIAVNPDSFATESGQRPGRLFFCFVGFFSPQPAEPVALRR